MHDFEFSTLLLRTNWQLLFWFNIRWYALYKISNLKYDGKAVNFFLNRPWNWINVNKYVIHQVEENVRVTVDSLVSNSIQSNLYPIRFYFPHLIKQYKKQPSQPCYYYCFIDDVMVKWKGQPIEILLWKARVRGLSPEICY